MSEKPITGEAEVMLRQESANVGSAVLQLIKAFSEKDNDPEHFMQRLSYVMIDVLQRVALASRIAGIPIGVWREACAAAWKTADEVATRNEVAMAQEAAHGAAEATKH